ncbi:TetR/AcrR family transcriptional regulator [Bauldia sp.]|uniref:TetR/AcrR family transcriptional regulator n=1 Tax=Bauldia sp. TaxID=2575872 RepID=UPI003BAD8264
MRKRFRREDWLAFGLARLADDGPDALKLAALCRAADRTIGSFYHHFDDQADFLAALLQYWQDKNTTAAIDANKAVADPDAQVENLDAFALSLDHRVEVGIRRLGYQDRAVAEKIAVVDERRIEYVTALYRKRFGLPGDDARSLAQLDYAVFVGSQMMGPAIAADDQVRLSKLFARLVRSEYGASAPASPRD